MIVLAFDGVEKLNFGCDGERLEPELGQVYASPVLAEGKLYYVGRGGRAAVVAAKPTL